MEECKAMPKPMILITNLKKVTNSSSDLVDPMFYRWLIGSLMYLVNNMPDICFSVNTLNQVMVKSSQEQWVSMCDFDQSQGGDMFMLRFCWFIFHCFDDALTTMLVDGCSWSICRDE